MKISLRAQCANVDNCRSRCRHAQVQWPSAIQIAESIDEMAEIAKLRQNFYRKLFPEIQDFHTDEFDKHSVVLFSRNAVGEIDSTARLATDSLIGLPEDSWFPPLVDKLRQSGSRLMELGRFIIDRDDPSFVRNYYRAFYIVSQMLESDYIVMAMQPRHVAFHRKLIGARVVDEHLGLTYGGEVELVCVLWNLRETNVQFLNWIGGVA